MKKEKKKIQAYEAIISCGVVISIQKLNKPKFVPILGVLTIGLFVHKFMKGDYVKLIFNHNISDNTLKLVYLLSHKNTSFLSLQCANKFLSEFAKKNNISEINSIIVNKRLNEKILNKYGWFYIKKNWFIGSHYKKIIL